jgi:hypothetical protein
MGFGQSYAEFALDVGADGARPIRVTHCCTSAAVDDAHESHHLRNDAELIIHKYSGRCVLRDEGLSVLHHGGMQLGKGQLCLTIV